MTYSCKREVFFLPVQCVFRWCQVRDSLQLGAPGLPDVGGRLRRLRKEAKFTQAELARQIGIQQSDLSRMEKGEYRVSLDNLFKILGVFGVKVSEFFDEAPAQRATARPLEQEDMQVLHLLRKLSTQGRQEAMEFLEFKVRREQTDQRARQTRQHESESVTG